MNTARSRRQIVLTSMAVAALRGHRLRQLGQRIAAAHAWRDMDLVFTNGVGGPVDAANLVHRSFRQVLRRAGSPQIRFHDLRHTAATLLLGRNIHPKVVSEQLGHSQVAITLDLYSHVTPTMQNEAAAALEVALGGR